MLLVRGPHSEDLKGSLSFVLQCELLAQSTHYVDMLEILFPVLEIEGPDADRENLATECFQPPTPFSLKFFIVPSDIRNTAEEGREGSSTLWAEGGS